MLRTFVSEELVEHLEVEGVGRPYQLARSIVGVVIKSLFTKRVDVAA